MNEISLSINIPTLIFFTITLLTTGVFSFFIGYLLGRIKSNDGVYNIVKKNDNNYMEKNTTNSNKTISIDEGKIVSNINTDDLSKKYESLGEVKASEENITGSINKLKDLKK